MANPGRKPSPARLAEDERIDEVIVIQAQLRLLYPKLRTLVSLARETSRDYEALQAKHLEHTGRRWQYAS